MIYKLEKIKMLYHGTDAFFEQIDPMKGKRFKDFGRGFYTTTNLNQAIRWAQRRAEYSVASSAYVYSFSINHSGIKDCNVLELLDYDENWLAYVTKCRKTNHSSEYDIIYDRMADGSIADVLDKYYMGNISSKDALKQLSGWKQKNWDQYCFKTESSLGLLVRLEIEDVSV